MTANIFSFFQTQCFRWLFLTLFAIVIFFSGAFNEGIPKDQEGRAAIIVKNILATGDWLNINAPGEIESEKPIMSYWLCAASCWIFGINEFGLRIPAILAGIFTVLMTCYLGSRIYGTKTGFLSGYLIGTMIFFVFSCHIVFIDAVLCSFYLASMIFLYKGYFEHYKAAWYLYLFYIILGFAVMLKGPVSVLLAGLTILFLIVKKRNLKIIWELKPISGLIILFLITVPWYAYECIHKGSGFGWDFFINQNISRFTGLNMTYKEGKRGSYFFYFANLLYGALPWSILIPFALIAFWKKLLKLSDKTYFLIFWIAAVLIFFSLAAIKRGDYILPLYPALAILIAHYMQTTFFAQKFKYPKIWNSICIALLVVGLIAGILIKTGLLKHIGKLAKEDKLAFISKWDGTNMIAVSDWINAYFLLTLIFLFAAVALIYYFGKLLQQGKNAKVVNIAIVLSTIFSLFYFMYLVPFLYHNESVKNFCKQARLIIPQNEVVCYFSDWNTEAVFFNDRKYERTSDFYNEKTEKLKFRFIFTSPDGYKGLSENIKKKLFIVLETVQGHRNPLVLLEVKSEEFCPKTVR